MYMYVSMYVAGHMAYELTLDSHGIMYVPTHICTPFHNNSMPLKMCHNSTPAIAKHAIETPLPLLLLPSRRISALLVKFSDFTT